MLTSLLLLAPLAALLQEPPPPAPAPNGGEEAVPGNARTDSLEGFLRRARARRDALRAQLQPAVDDLVTRLEEVAGRPGTIGERLQDEIVELGPEAAPLFLPHLDPGEPKRPGPAFRAEAIARALARVPTEATTEGLFRLATEATHDGRLHALFLLGHQPRHDERIDAFLAELFGRTEGEVHLAALRAMARRGGNHELLERSLGDADPAVAAEALRAFAQRRSLEAAPAVRALAADGRAAAPVLGQLVRYYRACPSVVGEQELEVLIPLLLRESVELADKVDLLAAIPTFTTSLDLRLRRLMEPLLESPTTELREAALVCMTLLGSRSAKKDLLRFYDDRVEDNDGWPKAWEDRGDVYVRIGAHSDATKDYKQALELLGDRAALTNYRDLWIKLARAYTQSGKLRQALDTLEEFGLGPELRELVLNDPAFEPLVSNSRYGRAFR